MNAQIIIYIVDCTADNNKFELITVKQYYITVWYYT